jgi:hypothetical protein
LSSRELKFRGNGEKSINFIPFFLRGETDILVSPVLMRNCIIFSYIAQALFFCPSVQRSKPGLRLGLEFFLIDPIN